MADALDYEQIAHTVDAVLDDLNGKKADITGVVVVAFGPGPDGALLSKVAAIVADETQLMFAHAYAAVLNSAAALPPGATPGFASEVKAA